MLQRERERERSQTLYCIKLLGCMYKGEGGSSQFNNRSDISFEKGLVYTGGREVCGGGGRGQLQNKGQS